MDSYICQSSRIHTEFRWVTLKVNITFVCLKVRLTLRFLLLLLFETVLYWWLTYYTYFVHSFVHWSATLAWVAEWKIPIKHLMQDTWNCRFTTKIDRIMHIYSFHQIYKVVYMCGSVLWISIMHKSYFYTVSHKYNAKKCCFTKCATSARFFNSKLSLKKCWIVTQTLKLAT